MTLESLRAMDVMCNTSNLEGGDIESISREGDLCNTLSIGTAAVFTAQALFKENTPYVLQYDADNNMSIVFNTTFLRELRRQLSGDTTSNFVPKSQELYDQYLLYINDIIPSDEIELAVVEALDIWIVDEVQELSHPCADRDFTDTHKWNKLIEDDTQCFTEHTWFKVLKREE